MTTHHHPHQALRGPSRKVLRLLCVAGALSVACASAQAVTVSQYGHDLKEDASHAGHAIVRVGSDTGHGVVHAAKTVGGDVAHGVKHGYHATRDALSSKSKQPAGKTSGTH